VSCGRRRAAVALALLVGAALVSCFLVVDASEHVVVLRLGRVARAVAEPGLHLKLPYPLEQARRLDRRLLSFAPGPAEYLTEDRKNLVIASLVTWRIADPVRFVGAVDSRAAAEERLADVVLTRIGAVLGAHPASALIAVEGHGPRFARVMDAILGEARGRVRGEYGIELVDVRMRQVTLPEQNRANVFARMQAERGKIAMKFRSEGEREFKKIVAEAQAETTRIQAGAYREAERLKAEGDAEAMRIYAEGSGKNASFYKFMRTLQAYEKLLDGNTTVFLPADAEVFRLLEGGRGSRER
jgi:modulator of FtsH protease HflC